MDKINWGIIGLGNIANKFAESCLNLDNAVIKGIASGSENNLESFKKKFNIEDKFCFNNYDDLILCPEIDIIYIALPNSLHALYINKSLKNNKNVLVEKPAFTNSGELKVIKDLCSSKKIYFTEGFMYRYLPYFQKLKEIIHNEILGKVVSMESTFNIKVYKQKKIFGLRFKKPDFSNRLFNKELGGGAILDIGCYPLSISTFVNSLTYKVNIEDIKLEKLNTLYCESGVDIFSQASLNFDNKFFSKINCSFKDNLDQCTKINFENGSLTIDETWIPNQKMSISLKNQNEISKIDFSNDMNIYAYQIKAISGQLLDKKTNPTFPSITMEEIEINTKIIEDWINSK